MMPKLRIDRSVPPIATVAWFLLLWLSGGALAQTKEGAIDSLMRDLSHRGQFSGSVLVVEHGNRLYQRGFGYADTKENLPFTATTPCYVASLTKQFTAMAIMMLNERHRLSYNDPLSKYFPQFPPYARKITLLHLLHHTSGIPDYVGLGLERPGLTDNDVLQALLKLDSLNFTPGEKFEYSNSGYVLLGLIIEKVSGLPYGVFLKKNIFDPLGMNDTFVDDSSRPYLRTRARGYNRFGDDADYDLLTCGEGGIYASVEDFFKWDQALYTEKLVKRSTLEDAFTEGTLHDGSASNYGFGWALGEYEGQPTASHAGRYGGFNTYIKRFMNDRDAVIFLTNHDFKNMRAIGDALTNILYGKPYVLPKLSVAEAMFKLYESDGVGPAIKRYRDLKATNDTTYDYGESELNELGYELLGMKRFKDAIEILKLNVDAYPASWNVYDGLGEAYMDDGENDLAVKNYKKSLELDAGNSNAVLMLRKLGIR